MHFFVSPRLTAFTFRPAHLIIAVILGLMGAKLIAPVLISAAYQKKSISFLNAIISGGNDYPLHYYFDKFSAFFNIAVFVCALFIYWIWVYELLRKKTAPGNYSLSLTLNNLSIAQRYCFFSGIAAIVAVGGFLFTVYPRATYVNIMTHDTFIFYDGAYRLAQGQVPHLDFHTPIGALAYFLPFLGFSILKQLPGALEFSNFIVGLFVLAISVIIFSARYRVFPAVLVLLYLYLIIIVPMNVGAQELTHAMFYNRYGWVCLTLLYLLIIEPEQITRHQTTLDVICISTLMLMLFYLKLTYFVFGAAFLALWAFKSEANRRAVTYSAGILFLVAAIVESFFPELHYRYLSDVWMAIQSSGVVREKKSAPSNVLPETIILLVAGYFALRAARPNILSLAYLGLILVSSLMIINQNYQTTGLVPIIAFLLWAHESSARQETRINSNNVFPSQLTLVSTALFSLMILFIAQSLIERGKAAADFYTVVTTRENRYATPLMNNFYVGDRENDLNQLFNEKKPDLLFKQISHTKRKQPLTQGEYLETIEEGYDMIKAIDKTGEEVMVFDLANPFSFLLKTKPPEHDYSFYDPNRDISEKTYPKGEELFQSVKYVMIPKFPMLPATPQFLKEVYGSYLRSRFEKVADSHTWEVYQHR